MNASRSVPCLGCVTERNVEIDNVPMLDLDAPECDLVKKYGHSELRRHSRCVVIIIRCISR